VVDVETGRLPFRIGSQGLMAHVEHWQGRETKANPGPRGGATTTRIERGGPICATASLLPEPLAHDAHLGLSIPHEVILVRRSRSRALVYPFQGRELDGLVCCPAERTSRPDECVCQNKKGRLTAAPFACLNVVLMEYLRRRSSCSIAFLS